MTMELDTTLILTLADILADKQINTENINKYLDVICDDYLFDCGLIYEIDQFNFLHLKERRISEKIQFHQNFEISRIDSQLRDVLSKKTISYIIENDSNTPYQKELLQFFFARTLITVAVVDENFRIHGFIIFMNAHTENIISEKKLSTLTVLANILEKYIATRVYKNKISFAQNSLASILDNTGIDIYVNDFHSHEILYVNRSMAAPYGGKAQFMGHKCWEILFPGQRGPCEFCPQQKLIDDDGSPTKIYSWNYQRPFDGSWFRVFSAAFRWMDGRLAHVVSSADITENKRNEALIHYMANYDPLTNLPNRRMLVSECERRITHAQQGEKAYLLFFDIDGFKAINDNYGHDAGDEFLVQLGAFFSGIPMLKDSIYRNGGDEFVALIGEDVSEINIRNLARFIHERFKNAWILKNGSVFCNTSIGVASYPEDGETAESLVNKADQAMYHMKKSGGGGIRFYRELP